MFPQLGPNPLYPLRCCWIVTRHERNAEGDLKITPEKVVSLTDQAMRSLYWNTTAGSKWTGHTNTQLPPFCERQSHSWYDILRAWENCAANGVFRYLLASRPCLAYREKIQADAFRLQTICIHKIAGLYAPGELGTVLKTKWRSFLGQGHILPVLLEYPVLTWTSREIECCYGTHACCVLWAIACELELQIIVFSKVRASSRDILKFPFRNLCMLRYLQSSQIELRRLIIIRFKSRQVFPFCYTLQAYVSEFMLFRRR